VALALAPLGAGAQDEHEFVTSFLARWGEAFNPSPASAPARGRRKR
jgi:hypothetical protein